ncbi:hypothetical protein ACFW04_013056 [Cataglyphis niger]
MLNYICSQLKFFQIFANLDVTSPQIYDRFNKLLYIYLIRMTRKLADVSFILLVEFIANIFFTGFQYIIAMIDKNTVIIRQSLMAQIIDILKLKLSIFIENLKCQMENIDYSIYQSACYEFLIKLKNLVLIFMQIKVPVMFQAKNFIEVKLSTLVNILKTSFLYLSVLRVIVDS